MKKGKLRFSIHKISDHTIRIDMRNSYNTYEYVINVESMSLDEKFEAIRDELIRNG